jgi:hypothetical protein
MWLIPTPARSNPVIVAYVRGDGSGPPRNGSNPARTSGGKKNVLGHRDFRPTTASQARQRSAGAAPAHTLTRRYAPSPPSPLRRYADIPDSDGYHHL